MGMCDDFCFVVLCVFEDAYALQVCAKRIAHLRSPTRQGFKGEFWIFDYAERHFKGPR